MQAVSTVTNLGIPLSQSTKGHNQRAVLFDYWPACGLNDRLVKLPDDVRHEHDGGVVAVVAFRPDKAPLGVQEPLEQHQIRSLQEPATRTVSMMTSRDKFVTHEQLE